jgi:hypothetical protein
MTPPSTRSAAPLVAEERGLATYVTKDALLIGRAECFLVGVTEIQGLTNT